MQIDISELGSCIQKMVDDGLYKMIISKPFNRQSEYRRIEVSYKKDYYQIAKYTQKQVFHQNVKADELAGMIRDIIEGLYGQVNAWSDNKEYQLLISKKDKISYTSKNLNKLNAPDKKEGHNNSKQYILKEGEIIQPLIDMGIFTNSGKVVNSMQDKYRQINRFIEIIDDAIRKEDYNSLNIIDFGCGKSYLTFVMYYYFTEIKNIKVNMIGLDLKADVIDKCNKAARKYGYSGLRFELGDINGFDAPFDVDMVVTLHACDTATDYAMYNAITWGAKMIFSVPCCQHEVNKQIKTDELSILTRYGIVCERFSALMTDAVRANLLEYSGYKTQLLEFVDLDNTPKNILVRAVKTPNMSEAVKRKAVKEVRSCMKEFNIEPTLYKLLCEKG